MFGISYMKAPPTTYVMHYKGGKLAREGAGLSFFYFAPTALIVHVPMASTDVPFSFTEVTADFQDVTLDGQLTYRVTDARRLASLLDLSVNAQGRYISEDLARLNDRLIATAQALARVFTQRSRLHDVLAGSNALVKEITDGLRGAEAVTMLGIEVLGVTIQAIKASPEMSKAMQADAREALLRKADEAIYARRNAAVEQERIIKENELNTEIAVEAKRRQVRETQMQADVAVEQQRAALVEKRVENQRKESEAKAFALKAMLEPMKDVDWRTLLAASSGANDPRTLIALAFRDLADGASKIGQLNITPDLLQSLLAPPIGHEQGSHDVR